MEVTLQDVASQVTELSKQLEQLGGRLEEFSGIERRLTGHVETNLKAAVDELKHQAIVNMEELKREVKLTADGYGGTLEHIERELVALNKKVDTRLEDHDLVLANHNERITTLAKRG